MKRLKQGDEVVVTVGKDKGRRGAITRVHGNGRLIVEGINMVTRHVKPNPQKNVQGGRVQQPAPIHGSNVMLYNPAKGAADRVAFKVLEDGRKVRVFKSDGEVVLDNLSRGRS